MINFTEADHTALATLFNGTCGEFEDAPAPCSPNAPCRKPYKGYKPEVREAPNGDTKACSATGCDGGERKVTTGVYLPCTECHGTGCVPNVDAGKRYLHVALKYGPLPAFVEDCLARAHWLACQVAEALKVPDAYYPRAADGTLRVLEYPAGAGSAEHTDPNLFSLLLWRSTPGDLELVQPDQCPSANHCLARSINPGLHIGEIGALVGLGPATPHRVPARPYAQKSLVYFAVPDHAALLPDGCGGGEHAWRVYPRMGQDYCPACGEDREGGPAKCAGIGPTVGEWLKERMDRSRY